VLGEAGQASRVCLACRGEVEYTIVARKLAFSAKASLDPEKDGIEGEEHEHYLLQKIGPIVEASKMFHLVQENMLKFLRRKSLEQVFGQQNSRMEEAGNTGTIYLCRDAQLC